MKSLTSTVPCRAYGGVDIATGEVVVPGVVRERVEWLSNITRDITIRIVTERWNERDIAVLAAGNDGSGRRLPSSGHVALARLGWGVTPPDGVYVPSRVMRVATEHAARLLRAAVSRDAVIDGIAASWPVNPVKRTPDEWGALWAAVPTGTTRAVVRNRTRQIAAYLATSDGTHPTSVTVLEGPPRVSGQILFAAADQQLVTLQRDGRVGNLTVKLPTVAHPTCRNDWEWVTLRVRIPGHVPADAVIHTPTVRIADGQVCVDVPWTIHAPAVRRTGHARALGLDWGVNTLLTGTIGTLRVDRDARERVITNGQPLTFNAAGVSAKVMRLRTQRERLAAKRDQYTRLGTQTVLLERVTVEHDRVAARLRNLGRSVSWAAAHWAVAHAVAHHATVIYIEDLTTMETRGLGRATNRRLGQHIRSDVFDALRHLAAKVGIIVVTVPARGASAGCPRCGRPLKHVNAPNDHRTGHKWSTCSCGLSSDRDHAAAERIVARGLIGQPHTRTNRAGTHSICVTVDTPVRRNRDKHTRTSPRMPRRRTAPAPGDTPGQRPAGQSPTRPTPTGVSKQGLHTSITPHGTSRAGMLRCGFHSHVRATPHPPPTRTRA